MSFLFSKPVDQARLNQINDLHTMFPSIREITSGSSYELTFLASNNYCTLCIGLAPTFPTVKPELRIIGPINHAWIDSSKTLSQHPGIISWTSSRKLCDLVQEIIAELSRSSVAIQPLLNLAGRSNSSLSPPSYTAQTRNPTVSSMPFVIGTTTQVNPVSIQPQAIPPPISTSTSSVARTTANPFAVTLNPYNTLTSPMSQSLPQTVARDLPPSYSTNNSNSNSRTPIPQIPDKFPEIDSMSESTINSLLADSGRFAAHINNMPSVVLMKFLHLDVLTNAAGVAESNLESRQEIAKLEEEARGLMSQVKSAEDELKASLLTADSVTVSGLFQWEVDVDRGVMTSLMNELMKEGERLDFESQECLRLLDNGQMALSDCLRTFVDQRQKFHVLQARQHLVAKRQVEVVHI